MNITRFHQNIENALREAENVSAAEMTDALAKAASGTGLNLAETAKLLRNAPGAPLLEQASLVKEKFLGSRVAIFAPLYLANTCTNSCLYCAFRQPNQELIRRHLNAGEIAREAKILAATGHRLLLLICGEDPKSSTLDYLTSAIQIVRETPGIARVNLEVAPLEKSVYQLLKQAGAGTYILFQETYHPDTYTKMHPAGPKANYANRLQAPLNAAAAGFTELGLGILLGLRDYYYDFLGLVAHAYEIKERFGFFPTSFSLPRLKPAYNTPLQIPPSPLDDLEFQRVAALLRLVFPTSEILLTTREAPALRDSMMRSGISMLSAGSKTYPGGYSATEEHSPEREQFYLDDVRSLEEIVLKLVEVGEVPSFTETGGNSWQNAVLSFAGYLAAYATPTTCEKGKDLLRQLTPRIENSPLQEQIDQLLGVAR